MFGKTMKALEVMFSWAYIFAVIYAIQINFAWNGLLIYDLENIARSVQIELQQIQAIQCLEAMGGADEYVQINKI